VKTSGQCPACGSGRYAVLLYEFPKDDPRLQEDLKNRHALLTGRARTGNDPSRRCLQCGFEWDHARGRPA